MTGQGRNSDHKKNRDSEKLCQGQRQKEDGKVKKQSQKTVPLQ